MCTRRGAVLIVAGLLIATNPAGAQDVAPGPTTPVSVTRSVEGRHSESWVPPAEIARATAVLVAPALRVAPDSVVLAWDRPARVDVWASQSGEAPQRNARTYDPEGQQDGYEDGNPDGRSDDTWDGHSRLGEGSRPEAVRLAGGPDRAGWVTVVVRGPDGRPRTLRARAGAHHSRWVAAAALPRGRRLTLSDMVSVPAVVWGRNGSRTPAGASPAPTLPTGWLTRRALAPGESLVAPAVIPAPAIVAGDTVTVTREQGGIVVMYRGIAQHAAAVGKVVLVVIDAGRCWRATVVGPGAARVLHTSAAPESPPPRQSSVVPPPSSSP